MPRNTFLLICALTVIAALIVGVNIGQFTAGSGRVNPTSTPIPTPAVMIYKSDDCGIQFSYPARLTKLDTQAGAVIFVDASDTTKSLAVTCQKEIPRPPITEDKIENIMIGDIQATIYHDASEKDGTPINKLLFTHPKNTMDVFISGYGESFSTVVASLKIVE